MLSQLRKPGCEVIIGGLMSAMDMQTAVYCYGSPEMALLSAGYTEITKWLGVPEYETAGCSDTKCFDEQACLEAAMNITTAALVGGNMIHDIGYIEQGLCSSPHMLVASDDIISRTKRVLRGIPVDDDTKALDVLDEIGPGGHFLGHDHTYKRFKTENWRSPLVDRSVYADWEASGSKNYQQRVTSGWSRSWRPRPSRCWTRRCTRSCAASASWPMRGTRTKSWTSKCLFRVRLLSF